ncbi:hypothetical protein [Flavobacterium sp.]|uniref:hypothetical protein n=1 Tax=Flavobacterium sp. TaxID=239 RepID=UPI003BECE293
MKKILFNFYKTSVRWHNLQFSVGIDKNYVANIIINKYVNLKKLKEQKIPFYEYVEILYHYYKLGKWDKLDNIFNKIMLEDKNSKNYLTESQSQASLEVKKYNKPTQLKKIDTIRHQKELDDNVIVIKLIKYYILIADSFNQIVTNNKVEEERIFFQNMYNKALAKNESKGINESKLIAGAIEKMNMAEEQLFINKFNPESNLQEAIDFFSVFKSSNEENNEKSWLTEEQFSKFIHRAFCENKSIPKQKLNTGNKEDAFIIKRFAEYFDKEKFNKKCTPKDRSKYVDLLTGNFIGWDFNKVNRNFTSVRSKRSWENYK